MNRGHGYARGASAFQRPENALKRAEELQKVGQKTAAVLALHDVLTSRRHRAWNKGLEEIVFRFIDLCVEERMGRYAKEALMQYRNTCQNVNINSLEEVIKYLLKKATDRAEEAQAKADVRSVFVRSGLLLLVRLRLSKALPRAARLRGTVVVAAKWARWSADRVVVYTLRRGFFGSSLDHGAVHVWQKSAPLCFSFSPTTGLRYSALGASCQHL